MYSVQDALIAAKKIQAEINAKVGPPDEGLRAATEAVVLRSLVRNTRGYIERVANQANGAYEKGWYDACAVMLRRLLETLIIEAFEENQISHKIKNSSGEFFYLRDLVDRTLSETTWNLSRNSKKAMPKLKEIGDQSAHSRRFIAHKGDIDVILPDIRVVVQELLSIAKIK